LTSREVNSFSFYIIDLTFINDIDTNFSIRIGKKHHLEYHLFYPYHFSFSSLFFVFLELQLFFLINDPWNLLDHPFNPHEKNNHSKHMLNFNLIKNKKLFEKFH